MECALTCTTKRKPFKQLIIVSLWCDFLDADAAVLMLKNKIHRIPVVNDQMQVIGKYSLLFV